MENTWTTLQIDQIGKTLASTLGDLRSLYARVHYAETGSLPEGISREDLVGEVKLEQGDISEEELFMDGLNGVYLGLDYAWTTRFIDMEKAEEEGGLAFRIAHPTDGIFAALVPDAILGRDESVKFTDKPVSLTPVREALLIASEKLASLVCRIAQLPEEEVTETVDNENRTCMRAEAKPWGEKDFAKLLLNVYTYVNVAWNSRFDETPVSSPEGVERRCKFPKEIHRNWEQQ